MNENDRLDEPAVEREGNGRIQAVRVAFGPHYFVELERQAGKVRLSVGATHHGISADASEVNGELEQFVNELQRNHVANSF